MNGKRSRPVRRGADGKGVLRHYLVGCLPYNLVHLAGSSSDSLNACGAASSGTRHKSRVKLAVKKQEPNAKGGMSTLG